MAIDRKEMKTGYYAVIFTTQLSSDQDGYKEMSEKMEELVLQQEGYLGQEFARNELGITVSYWKDLESIRKWRMQADHLAAQQLGMEKWYDWYRLRVCKVEREYHFKKSV